MRPREALFSLSLSLVCLAGAIRPYEPPFEGAAFPERFDLVPDPSGHAHQYIPLSTSQESQKRGLRMRNPPPSFIIHAYGNAKTEVQRLSSPLDTTSSSRSGKSNILERQFIPSMVKDADDVLGPNTTPTRMIVTTTPSIGSSHQSASTPSTSQSRFSASLSCDIDPTLCSKVASGFERALNRLASTFLTNRTILISATYSSFCDKDCYNSTFGWGASSSQWVLPGLDTVDPNYVYPQALAKQLAPYDLKWATSDIICEINHDAYLNASLLMNGLVGGSFWFPEDNTPIRSDQVDMEYLILHELVHGLGFFSSWGAYFYSTASPYYNLLVPNISPDQLKFLSPLPKFRTDNRTLLLLLSGFMPNPIFDKFLHSNIKSPALSLDAISADLQTICVSGNGTDVVGFVEYLMNNTAVYNEARLLWNTTITPSSLLFVPPNSSMAANLTLYTVDSFDISMGFNYSSEIKPGSFKPGTSVSHLDASLYYHTKDFLMRPVMEMGITLENLITTADPNITTSNSSTFSSTPSTSFSASSTPSIIFSSSTVVLNSTASPTPTSSVDPAIGPGILQIFKAMGYSTVDDPRDIPAHESNATEWQPRSQGYCSPAPGSVTTTSDAVNLRLLECGKIWSSGIWMVMTVMMMVLWKEL